MIARFDVRVGPVSFRIGSAWSAPIDALRALYHGYPKADGVADYTVRIEPTRPWRRWIRRSVAIHGDYMLPEAAPLAFTHALLGIEMGMNLQLALGERRFLLLHAATVEREGRAIILTGESGAGKSTLAALLGERGWRFMGDEFALIEPDTGLLHAFPRPVSLKNDSIAVMVANVDAERLGPLMVETPKGSVRHVRPNDGALAATDKPARPALVVYPRYGHDEAIRSVPPSENFVRLTQASTNYVALGERGYRALTGLVKAVPSVAIDFPDTEAGLRLIGELWRAL